MPKITINDKEIEVAEGLTVMQACNEAGIEIPHFCYHDRLKIAGNCRMCLVEMERAPKPVASCAMDVADGMVIKTNTANVKKAREGVMEFLLINHPLDCPICDQGGECDLQDQAFKYGSGTSRYKENKRAVKDKNLGPLVKTHMTRCIHCTRCVRFATEIAGVPELGAIGRGENMQITSYLEKSLSSELSGNVIDLCPVGALTSKPYAFKARSWELNNTESIDVMDGTGANIRVDSVGLEVMRILPKVNDDVNEEWISDKTRFAYDGLKNQRLDSCYIKDIHGKLSKASFDDALTIIFNKLKDSNGEKIAAIAGGTSSCEALFSLKKLLSEFGASLFDANQHNYKLDIDNRQNYLFNSSIGGLENVDLCLIIGANIRKRAPVIGARLGKLARDNAIEIYRIGEADDQAFPIIELGDSATALDKILSAKTNDEFASKLKSAKNPAIIVGDGIFARADGFALLAKIHEIVKKYKIIRPDWNGFNILHNDASMVGALELGFIASDPKNNRLASGSSSIINKANKGQIDVLYLHGADEIDLSKIDKNTFVIYQGHHGDNSAPYANVILPSAAYTEQNGTYLNIEGRVQKARKAVEAPGHALEDWKIFAKLAYMMGVSKWPKSEEELKAAMIKAHPELKYLNKIIESSEREFNLLPVKDQVDYTPIKNVKFNFYMTDPISRNSVTMARCSKEVNLRENASFKVK